MFSPGDIDQLLGFARAQGDYGTPSNSYLGMVAPNGMHYVIRFSGNYNDALLTFQNTELSKYTKKFSELENDLTEPFNNGATYIQNDGSLNNIGAEKLFFETLKDMGLWGKIALQRIESDGTVHSINIDNNNQPVAIPCS